MHCICYPKIQITNIKFVTRETFPSFKYFGWHGSAYIFHAKEDYAQIFIDPKNLLPPKIMNQLSPKQFHTFRHLLMELFTFT